MPRRRSQDALSAKTCREITAMEIRKVGPLSVFEMYSRLTSMFPATDYRVFASALVSRNSGLCIIDGVIDTLSTDTPRPTAKHEREKVKRHISDRIMRKDGRAALRRVR